MPATVQDLESLLQSSAATEAFKQAVRDLQSGRPGPEVQFNRGTPPVKATRAIMKLLEEMPDEKIENVSIEGRSGCSDFEGTMKINGGATTVHFVWDCAWRAKQEGYKDHWGSPDQIRAAREFGYQCFEKFERR